MGTRRLVWKILLAAAIVGSIFLLGIYLDGCTIQAQFAFFLMG